MLTEAAEVEHCLMCCYLYAAFTLKSPADPSLTLEEQSAVKRWRTSIREVAVEEMLHLTLVQNLLASIGAAAHLQRPNFPVAPGMFPSGIVVELRPFTSETLEHFIFLERPEDMAIEDGEGFPSDANYDRSARPERLTASAQDYGTIGALYRGIERSFEHLAASLGEHVLFVGDARAQVDAKLLKMEGVLAVTDLASAKRAIERIIEQGEGARRKQQICHFERFTEIRDEYARLRASRPAFEPAHPVVANPVMNKPLEAAGRAYVDSPEAARLLDLANAVYGLVVQCLARFFGHIEEETPRRVLIDVAIGLMGGALAPLADSLALLPASPSLPGHTAGVSFTLPRSTHALPQRAAGWALIHERSEQLAGAAAGMAAVDDRLGGVAACLDEVRQKTRVQWRLLAEAS